MYGVVLLCFFIGAPCSLHDGEGLATLMSDELAEPLFS